MKYQYYQALARLELASHEWRYAMVNRAPSFSTLPKGAVRYEERPRPGANHHDIARNGVVVFDRQLTDHETESFELAPMLEGKDLADLAKQVAEQMSEYADAYKEMYKAEPKEFLQAMQDNLRDVVKGYPPSIGDEKDFAKLVLHNLR